MITSTFSDDVVLIVFFVFVVVGRDRFEFREKHFADLALLQRVVLLQDLLVQPVGMSDARNGVGNALEKQF